MKTLDINRSDSKKIKNLQILGFTLSFSIKFDNGERKKKKQRRKAKCRRFVVFGHVTLQVDYDLTET